ncbi:MAG: ABC transporter ATP-binding protein/permease [Oscillospiraceae bacterium]|nr:ABC transporter ATP-binding protein/permease [Oscillospiraceae bacterium]
MKKYFLKHKMLLAAVILANLVLAALSASAAFILRDALNVALEMNLSGFRNVIVISAIYLPIFAASRFLVEVLSAKLGGKIIQKVRHDVFSGIMSRDMTTFGSVNSADYISALSNDIELFEKNYLSQIFLLIYNVLTPIFAIGIMFYLSPIVAGFVLLSLVLLVVIPSLFGKGLQSKQEKLSGRLSLFTIKNKDIFSGFEVIKSYQMAKQANKDFAEQNKEVYKAQLSFDYIRGVTVSLSMFLGLLTQIGTILVAAYLIIQGNLTGGALLALVQASSQISMPLQMLSEAAPMISGSKAVVARLLSLAQVEDSPFGTDTATFDEAISIKNLEFAYPENDAPVLKNINFTFEKNKKYALIGKSGCGKTTLTKAMVGYLRDYQGKIVYDTSELHALSEDSVGKLSSMIHQNVYMFDEDIAKNIHLDKDYEDADFRAAIDDSGVAQFLDNERTLETQVGENGSNLSGGQRQRIAVARALTRNKPLMILDEGTSAVDRLTARDIETRLLGKEDLTLITITHALDEDMLSQYDEIIYMEDGTIAEHGHYLNLVSQDGSFSKFLAMSAQ